jgi:hypothetical protein
MKKGKNMPTTIVDTKTDKNTVAPLVATDKKTVVTPKEAEKGGMSKAISSFFFALAIVLSVGAVSASAYMSVSRYTEAMTKQAQYKAVDDCFKSAEVKTFRRDEADKKDLTITEPVKDIYTYCLKDKGIQLNK